MWVTYEEEHEIFPTTPTERKQEKSSPMVFPERRMGPFVVVVETSSSLEAAEIVTDDSKNDDDKRGGESLIAG